MNESALRTLLDNLDASRSSLHGLLHVFTFFVVVGLGFDLFVIIKEFGDDLKEFRRGEIHPPGRPSVLLLVLALVGTALIVLGVAGELYIDVKAGKVETDIRAANDALLGLISQEAGTAKSSAEGAATASSLATRAAQTAQSAPGKAVDMSSKATASASDALSLADGARKETESIEQVIKEERKTSRELQKSLAPRQIESIQIGKETNFDDLKPFAGMRVILEYIPDAECELAASTIMELVKRAGWTTEGTPTPNPQERPGVLVEWYMHFDHTEAAYSAERQSREAADELVSFLKAYDWVAEGRGAGERMNNVFCLCLCLLPLPSSRASIRTLS